MKRLTYIPGIWSLGLLLPLCVWYLYRQDVWKQERCITMTFPIPADQRDEYDDWLRLAPKELRQEWIDLTCDGRQAEIDATLLSFRDSLRELESREDTVRGIHVHFGPNAKYATIIDAIGICRTTVMFWSLEGHDLWTGHRPEPRRELLAELFRPDPGYVRMGQNVALPRITCTSVLQSYGLVWCLLALMGLLGFRSAIRTVKLA